MNKEEFEKLQPAPLDDGVRALSDSTTTRSNELGTTIVPMETKKIHE